MIKNSKYLLITTFFSFLFCSGCLQHLSGGYQPIGMENWVRKHIESEIADYYDQNKESIESEWVKHYLDSVGNIEALKDLLTKKRFALDTLTPTVDQQMGQNVGEIVLASRSEKLTLRVYEIVQEFNEKYLPQLKNRNLSEKEISSLRFQSVCEWIAWDVKVIEQALKLKQEQEQEQE